MTSLRKTKQTHQQIINRKKIIYDIINQEVLNGNLLYARTEPNVANPSRIFMEVSGIWNMRFVHK